MKITHHLYTFYYQCAHLAHHDYGVVIDDGMARWLLIFCPAIAPWQSIPNALQVIALELRVDLS